MIVSFARRRDSGASLFGGILTWVLPASGAHIGVTLRAGANGAVIPALSSSLSIGGSVQGHSDAGQTPAGRVDAPVHKSLSARYPATEAAIIASVSLDDVARVCPRGQRVTLHATVTTTTGQRVHTFSLWLDDQAPDGLIRALITADGTYFSARNMDADSELLTVYTQGGEYTLPFDVSQPVTFAPGQVGRPLTVTATDHAGNVSSNLLVSVQVQGGDVARETAFSAWPLPPYLDATQPNLGAVLRAFEAVLDVQPDYAGLTLSLGAAEGETLTLLAGHFGAVRREGEPDSELQARALSVLTPGKSTRGGLSAMLRAAGVFGATIKDLFSLGGQPPAPLTFDGTHHFDAAQHFDGMQGGSGAARYGMVLAVFGRVPAAGFEAAHAVLTRYVAAGVGVKTVLASVSRGNLLASTGVRAKLTYRHTFQTVRGSYQDNGLKFNSYATFDGSQTFDGTRN